MVDTTTHDEHHAQHDDLDVLGSPRLTQLLRMRAFIDADIATERQRIASSTTSGYVRAAAALYGTTVQAIHGPGREKSVTNARMVACWLLRETGLSYPEIGRAVGRDHTTVMHAVRTIAADPARRRLARQLLAEQQQVA